MASTHLDEHLQALIDGYYNGSLSPEEIKELNDLLLNSPDSQAVFLREGVLQGTMCEWAKHEADTTDQAHATDASFSPKLLPFRPATIVAIAAALFIIASVVFTNTIKHTPTTTLHQTKLTQGSTIRTDDNETKTVLMAKGAHITLYPDSALQINKMTDNQCTLVSGTVHLQVPPQDPEDQLVIKTHAMDITVLGTAFTVRATNHDAQVDVLSGSVRVTTAKHTTHTVKAGHYLNTSITSAKETITYRLVPIKDATIEEQRPRQALGDSTILRVDARDPNEITGHTPRTYKVRALLQWDISAVPQNFTVTSATLDIAVFNIMQKQAPSHFELHALSVPWDEQTTTWTHRKAGTAWSALGASAIGHDHAATSLANLHINAKGRQPITLNAQGIQQIQAWLNAPATNHGILMTGQSPDGLDFYSREHKDASKHPVLKLMGTTSPQVQVSQGKID